MFYSAGIQPLNVFVCVSSGAEDTYLFTGLRKYAKLVHVCATLLTYNQYQAVFLWYA